MFLIMIKHVALAVHVAYGPSIGALAVMSPHHVTAGPSTGSLASVSLVVPLAASDTPAPERTFHYDWSPSTMTASTDDTATHKARKVKAPLTLQEQMMRVFEWRIVDPNGAGRGKGAHKRKAR